MDSRQWATLLLSVPAALAVALPLLILVGVFEASGGAEEAGLLFVMFAVGPALMLAGHWRRSGPLMGVGLVAYVGATLFWGFSWSGFHFVPGVPAAVAGVVLSTRPVRHPV